MIRVWSKVYDSVKKLWWGGGRTKTLGNIIMEGVADPGRGIHEKDTHFKETKRGKDGGGRKEKRGGKKGETNLTKERGINHNPSSKEGEKKDW